MGGALLFYTVIPLPARWTVELTQVARWAPLIGVVIGGILGAVDGLLQVVPGIASLREVLIVLLWIAVTGGLHLDGAMDTADGLGVFDPDHRLQVMQDSRTGAFGVLAAIALVLLKVTALGTIEQHRWYALILVATWGRWGQLQAIAAYPYLKEKGKGAFHRQTLNLPQDFIPGLVILLSLVLLSLGLLPRHLWATAGPLWLGLHGLGLLLAWAVRRWFYQQFQGMTGDIYGAIVEWTEALSLCGLSIIL